MTTPASQITWPDLPDRYDEPVLAHVRRRQTWRRTALHEAGHAVAAAAFNRDARICLDPLDLRRPMSWCASSSSPMGWCASSSRALFGLELAAYSAAGAAAEGLDGGSGRMSETDRRGATLGGVHSDATLRAAVQDPRPWRGEVLIFADWLDRDAPADGPAAWVRAGRSARRRAVADGLALVAANADAVRRVAAALLASPGLALGPREVDDAAGECDCPAGVAGRVW